MVPFYPFLEKGSPTKIDEPEKKWYPYSTLSTGVRPEGLQSPLRGDFWPAARVTHSMLVWGRGYLFQKEGWLASAIPCRQEEFTQ